MQAEKSELQKIIQTIWSSELYKIILSNPTGEGTYRKIVLNRQKKGWQAGQETEILPGDCLMLANEEFIFNE